MINKKQEERLDYLLEEFKKDSIWYKDLEVGRNYQEKRRALRSLMNIRMPGAMDSEVLKVQDDFLSGERDRNFGKDSYSGKAVWKPQAFQG